MSGIVGQRRSVVALCQGVETLTRVMCSKGSAWMRYVALRHCTSQYRCAVATLGRASLRVGDAEP